MSVFVVVLAAVALAAFAVLVFQRADPEKASSHEVERPRGTAYQPGDGRPAGPDAEAMRPLEGTASPAPEDGDQPAP